MSSSTWLAELPAEEAAPPLELKLCRSLGHWVPLLIAIGLDQCLKVAGQGFLMPRDPVS